MISLKLPLIMRLIRLMEKDSRYFREKFPNLEPFLQGEVDIHTAALIIAHQYRRGRARNSMTNYGTSSPVKAPYLSGANRDLVQYYEHRIALEEADRTSEEIYELLQDRQIDAILIINRMREEPDLELEEKAELLESLFALEKDIEKLTGLLEQLSA